MSIALIVCALVFCGLSVYCLCKANYCACRHAGECDNPVSQYWLGAIVAALLSLLLSCAALHSEKGTLLWVLMMASCMTGAMLSARWQNLKRRCKNAFFPVAQSKP
ncbi:hypothetical protein CBQ28_12330 [Pseudoalteromonas sp. GCY]|uniref:hypothetical protein n=1 Tax=Pseudoalteromonas sp. GCY TaxID=2003316 RepID=UPI000BFEDC9B|nr:hypothetical protein [Pseudoalteromonas sp. GCY]PHI36749.1 hypothetical protein CBQ28_12330 [Pseudoalteromonas sp. GCY]QQQ66731.1 hypothetical protein JJQ94_21170 [Pseudoalteromonas sp. GCY]